MENGQEFDLPSGAKLYVSVASFAQIKALHDAVFMELRGKGIGSLDVVSIQKTMLGSSDQGLNVLADKFLGLASSKEVEAAVFSCAEKAVYRPDGTEASSVGVTKAIFDDPKTRDRAREDYYSITLNVAQVNLKPFLKALSSLFAARVDQSAATQKSSSEPGPMKEPS